MPRPVSTIRDLLKRIVADAPTTSKTVRDGRRIAFEDEGTHSLFAWPVMALARKIKGKEKINRALYERYHRPLKNIDEKAGALLAEITGAKKLFRQIDVLPTTRKIGNNEALINHVTHSLTAPITKASKVVTPIAASLWIADKLMGTDEDEAKMASASEAFENKNVLLKEASDALEHAHRRMEAEKIAFTMVEKGKISPFSNYNDFHEKVASLLSKDLRVVEEALDMDSSLADFGKVAEERSTGSADPTLAFYHRLTDS